MRRSTLDNIYILNETKSITTCCMMMISARLLDFKFGNAELAQFFKRNKNMLFLQISGGGACAYQILMMKKENRRTNGQSITNGPPDFWSWLQLCLVSNTVAKSLHFLLSITNSIANISLYALFKQV